MDLCNGQTYAERPTVERFGRVELLRADGHWHSRTRIPYTSRLYPDRYNCIWLGFYLKIYESPALESGTVCILENDSGEVYRFHASFADGSILVSDRKGQWFHVQQGRKDRLPDRRSPFFIWQLREEAERRAVIRHEMGASAGRTGCRASCLSQYPASCRQLLRRGSQSPAMGRHHAGRKGCNRSALQPCGDKRKRYGPADNHTGQDENRGFKRELKRQIVRFKAADDRKDRVCGLVFLPATHDSMPTGPCKMCG